MLIHIFGIIMIQIIDVVDFGMLIQIIINKKLGFIIYYLYQFTHVKDNHKIVAYLEQGISFLVKCKRPLVPGVL